MSDVDSFFEEIYQGRKGINWGYTLGLNKLEELTDGLTKSTYVLLFASSGTGKSSLALYSYVYKPLMEHLEDDKFKIIFFALEMKKNFIYAKLMSIYLHERYHLDLGMKELFSRKKNYTLSEENLKYVEEARSWLTKVLKVLVVYDENQTADSMENIIQQELEKDGTFDDQGNYTPNNPDKLVETIVDHAGLLRTGKGRTKKEEIDRASHMLISFRNRTNLSIVFIMQSNRSVANIDRRKLGFNEPAIEDCKETGGPSEDAEIVLTVYNPAKDKLAEYRSYDIKQMGDSFRSIICLKSRYGDANKADCCYFNGKLNIWEEMPPPDKIYDYSIYHPLIIDKSNKKADKKNLKFTI